MKKIARMLDNCTVEFLMFEDETQNLSAETIVGREVQVFAHVQKGYNDFLIVTDNGKKGVISPDGELVLPIKFSSVRMTPSVIIATHLKELKAYHYDGKPWRFERQCRLIIMDYSNDCAILELYRYPCPRAIYSFREKRLLFEWTKYARLVGRYWFFENKESKYKVVCTEDNLSKLWQAEEFHHFSYAIMAKIDGEYKVYLPNGCVDNLGHQL